MIYIVRGSEDGTVGASHNAGRAIKMALHYISQSSEAPVKADKSALRRELAKRMWWVKVYSDLGTSADVEAFEADWYAGIDWSKENSAN